MDLLSLTSPVFTTTAHGWFNQTISEMLTWNDMQVLENFNHISSLFSFLLNYKSTVYVSSYKSWLLFCPETWAGLSLFSLL